MNIVEVVRIRFRWPGKMYEFRNPLGLPLKRGNQVVVQTDEGDELIGTVMIAPRLRLARREDEVLPPVLRTASDRELGMAEVANDYRIEIKNYFDTRMRSREMNGVKLVDIEKANGGQKLILYFASEQKRFNYRELAVEMAQRFKVRVDMRPVGIRDAARLSGGIGKCGLSLCCSTWLPDFQQISIRMAKDQGLSLDPESINGQCGRLLCCLGYEHQNYVEMGQGLPKVGKAVVTPKGDARVVKLDIIQGKITVRFEDGAYETYQSNEVKRKFGPGGQSQDSAGDDDSDQDRGSEGVQDDRVSDRSNDRSNDRPSDRSGERLSEREFNERPNQMQIDRPNDRSQDRGPRRDQNFSRNDGRSNDRSNDRSRDRSGGRPDNRPDIRQPRAEQPTRSDPHTPSAFQAHGNPVREIAPNDPQAHGDQRSDQPARRQDGPRNDNDRRPRRRGGRGGGRGPNRGDQGNRTS